MIYDLYDARRQWQTYLNALHLVHVPTDFTPGPAVTMAPGKLSMDEQFIEES